MSPVGYVERGCPKITESDAKALGASHLLRLDRMAEGRGETREDTLRAIVEFYVEAEDWRAEEMNLGDAVRWYLDNYYVA